MKRFLLAGLLFSIAAWGFSQNRRDVVQETWMTFGFEGGNYFENYKIDGVSYSDYTVSPGLAINGYNFVQDGIGWFMRSSILFPAYLGSKEDGGEQEDIRGDFSMMMQMTMLAGPAFKFSIGERADLYFGLGLGFMLSDGLASDYTLQQLNVGLAGADITSASVMTYSTNLGIDLGFKVDLTDRMFINIGASATWEFLVDKEMSIDFNVSGEKFSAKKSMTVTTAYNIRPYICVGFQSYAKYQMETGWGRAPKD